MTARVYYVLFNNDSPELVYDNESDAVAEASARQREARKEAREGYPTAYWHVHTVLAAPQ